MDGYEGDGFSCQPIDLCSQPERGGCSPNVSGVGLSKCAERALNSQNRDPGLRFVGHWSCAYLSLSVRWGVVIATSRQSL